MHSNNLITYGAVMGVIFLLEGISHSVSCTSTSSTGLFYRPDKLYTAPGPGKRALLDSAEDAQQQQQQRLDRYNVIVRSLMQRLPKYLPIHWFAFKSTTKKSAVYEQQQQQPAPDGIILLKDVQQVDRSSISSNDDEINNNNNNSGGVDDDVGELSSDDMFKAENMVSFF